MEIFYSEELHEANGAINAGFTSYLGEEESAHCIRVLRHRTGDTVNAIDGRGNMYECSIAEASPKRCLLTVRNTFPDWGGHDYILHVACCPTKNIDRYEWFLEKATEIGIDTITPIIGEHSERRTVKRERLEKLLLAATKQSLKGRIPALEECMDVWGFIDSQSDRPGCLKLIAYCFHDEGTDKRKDMFTEIERHIRFCRENDPCSKPEILVMVGPEGDFSEAEARHAVSRGFIPAVMGSSRLRTETAALMAAAATYGAYEIVKGE